MGVFFDSVGQGGVLHSPWINLLQFTQWDHTVIGSQAAVLVGISYLFEDTTPTSVESEVTLDGTEMESLGLIKWGTAPGWTEIYGLANVSPGKKKIIAQVTGSFISGRYITGNSVAYKGVAGFGTVATDTDTGTALSMDATASAASRTVVAYGGPVGLSAFNQTQRFLKNNRSPLLIGDAQGTGSSQTFSATGASSQDWGGVSVILNPADIVATAKPTVLDVTASGRCLRLPRPGINRRSTHSVPREG